MEDRTDIAIIGGGPAGLTLAKFLAEEGVSFILLEEDSSFYGKPCGEGITPSLAGYDFFDLYGSRKGVERITEEYLLRMDRGELSFHLPNIITSKKEVEEELARQARTKGGDIRMGEQVKRLVREGGSISLMPQGIQARMIVGADGFNSLVRKFMGIPGPTHIGIAATGYWAGEPPGYSCIAEFKRSVADHGYAWWFPRRDDWNIGVGTTNTISFRAQLDRFRARYPEVMDWKTAIVPLARPLRSYGKDTILVGDSASQVIAAFADGILPGMICARKAAEVLCRSSRHDFRDLDLALYEKAWRKSLGKTFREGYIAHRIMMGVYFSDRLLFQFMKLMMKMNRSS